MNRTSTRADTMPRGTAALVMGNPVIMGLVALLVGGMAIGCWIG